MSRLRELRLHGFKSFADPTRFVFEPGVNAVIGPNGSGKSNMADAVRWVLGEQSNRSLRTRRADDVIFAGSEQRKPQGMAEAVLTLDNADGWLPIDFAEVSIGRRAYRSGESEYLINGARARLRDVVDLLGSGRLGANELVVVGQGTVDAALSLRPEERRQLFEEAAGVKGLQVKRNEASSRLARALDNLTRVTDLIGELKPQVRRLALQAEHQQQHDTLGSRARALVSASHRRREQAARAALGETRRAAAAAEAALAAFRESQDAGREAISAAEASYWEAEEAAREAARARETTREALIRLESRLEGLESRRLEAEAAIEADATELGEAEARLGATDDDRLETSVAPALAAAGEAEERWQAAVTALAAADADLLAAEEALSAVRARESDRIAATARASEEDARQRARHEQASAELESTTTSLQASRDATIRARDAAEEARANADAANEATGREAAERDTAQAAADETRQEALEIGERLRATRAELDAATDSDDGPARLGARLAAAGWSSLLDSIEAPEASWAAIEAVVGGELEGALLWTDDDPSGELAGARGAARFLRVEVDDSGRAEALSAVAGTRTLAEWIGAADAPLAFQRTVVADDLAALLAGWRRLPAGWGAVTVEGDLADPRGIIVLRGRADEAGGASARAHARRRELTELAARLEREATVAQETAHDAAERLRQARETHLAASAAHDEASRTARRAREDFDAAEAHERRLTSRLEALRGELAALSGSRAAGIPPAQASDELSRLQAAAGETRRRRDAAGAARDAAREQWSATRLAAEEAESRTAGERRGRAVAEARVAQLRAGLPERRAALDRLDDERAAVATEATAAREADSSAEATRRAAEEARSARRTELLELERGQGGAGTRLAELEREAHATAIEASRRDEAFSALTREREVALDGLPESAAAGADDGQVTADIETLDDEALETELRRVRRTLGQIGSVNPFAVEEHRELAGRMAEMTTQDADLRAAIGSTEELIARLESEISEQFDAAFRAIAERFDEFCRLLFAGGSASLQMADEADGDAPGGIEIVVRPPGKRLQRLAMLSGGERALTGVALLFAMLTVNPVPFCILDEVDAALDEANIGRFAQALGKLSESIDFVVITHNRATIEVADTIYGVTMTDAAVSRLLSLRLADLPAEVTA